MKTLNKKVVLLALLLFGMGAALFAQPSKRTTAYNYYKEKQYDKALEAINMAIEHESTKQDPKTWYFRSAILYDIALSEDETVKSLDSKALEHCVESVFNSIKYDSKGKFTKDVEKVLYGAASELYNQAISQYNGDDYASALNTIQLYLQVLPKMGNYAMLFQQQLKAAGIEPNYIFVYGGDAAAKLEKYDIAKNYFNEAVKTKYDKIYPYLVLTDIYLEEGDTTQALEVVEKGKSNLSDDTERKNITIKELLIYQSMGKLDVLTEKLENAIKADPENANLYVTLGESYYQISSYHYIQNELANNELKKGTSIEDIKYEYGEPSKTETVEEEGKNITRFFYGNKFMNFVDGKLDSWKVDTKENVDHAAKASEYMDKAIVMYKTSLEKTEDPELLYALNSKIGTVFYNAGVDIYNKYVKERDEKKMDLLEAAYMEKFDYAIPFLEKSLELKPDDKTVIDELIKIYLLKQDMDKVTELNKLKNK